MNPRSSTDAADDRGANQAEWTISLPASIRHNDDRIKAAAHNLLRLPDVRSVTISGKRELATVHLRPRRTSTNGIADVSASVLGEPTQTGDTIHSEHASIVSWVDATDQSWSFIALPAGTRGLARWLLLAAAGLALVLGLLGIALPGLPTTPFVLVASYCLLRSSPRLHEKLLHSKLFGGLLRDWHVHRGLRPNVRYKATAVIVLVLSASLLLTTMPVGAKLLILAVAAIGVIYVWRLPSVAD